MTTPILTTYVNTQAAHFEYATLCANCFEAIMENPQDWRTATDYEVKLFATPYCMENAEGCTHPATPKSWPQDWPARAMPEVPGP